MTIQTKLAAITAGALAATTAAAQGWQIQTFDPPQAYFTIIPYGINDSGTVSGLWADPSQADHGFTLQGGAYSSFDVPLADPATKVGSLRGTAGGGINSAGTIAGAYTAGGSLHGFVRNAAGQTSTLDLAGHLDTELMDINDNGQILGAYADSHAIFAGTSFLRDAGGALQIVAMPASTFSEGEGLNNAGTVVGGYYDAANVLHGFVRAPNGVYTTIDVAGADATIPSGINDAGWIVGEYDKGGTAYAYVRDPDGNVSTLSVPGATFTSGTAINALGEVVGQYCDAANVCHGFLATPVPEPARWAMMLVGLATMAWRWRRRVGGIQ